MKADLLRTSGTRPANVSRPAIVPKYVFWVDNYPKTASGKIQKFKLRELGVEMLNNRKGLQ